MNRRDALMNSVHGLLLYSLPPLVHAVQVATPIIRTRQGTIAGYEELGIKIFKGIRYGADTAQYRFQSPKEAFSWDDVYEAFQYGAAAPQLSTNEAISEDCLFLNIWTQGIRDKAKRPILVYLHGGEYSTGSGSDPLYDGLRLCQRGGVVVITLNHRLNVFGHLYLGYIGDDKFRCSGNAGLLDIVLALKWINENASEFGGDPHNITLFGQSGGGAKIACLMAMPEAHGLFHRAMTMSGQQITVSGPRAAANRTQAYLSDLKLQTTDLKSLLNLPVDQIIQATKTHDPVLAGRSIYFGPVRDDVVLQQHPFYPEAPAISRHIPMIIGNTHDETRFFYGKDNSLFSLTWEELPRRLSEAMYVDISVDKVIAAYRNHYPEHSASEVFFAASTAGRSWRGAIIEAELRAQQRAPAYVYQLNFPSPEDDGRWRACHTLDIPLVFNNLDKPGSRTGVGTEASKVSEMMCDALIHFARYGKPGHAGIPHWDPYLLSNRATMIFDVNARIENDPRSFERLLFAQVPYIQRGTY